MKSVSMLRSSSHSRKAFSGVDRCRWSPFGVGLGLSILVTFHSWGVDALGLAPQVRVLSIKGCQMECGSVGVVSVVLMVAPVAVPAAVAARGEAVGC